MDFIAYLDHEISNLCPQPEYFDLSPFGLTDFRDCFIMELIKDAYFKSEPKQSLRTNRGNDDDDVRMRDSRYMAYAQHYRNLQLEHIQRDIGQDEPGLRPDDVTSMEGKLSGHHLTKMQYFEIKTIADHPLLKSITSKRICDVKKVSNSTFIEYMKDYDRLTADLTKELDGLDEDVIFNAIQLFTLEWKYNVELFYACAVSADENGVQELPKHQLAALCAELSMPIPIVSKMLHTESRFILHRLELVPAIYDGSDWNIIQDKIYQYFLMRYILREQIIDSQPLADFFLSTTTRKQWADFIRKHYDIRKIYVPKEWTNKRIRYVRSIYDTMLKDLEPPKL